MNLCKVTMVILVIQQMIITRPGVEKKPIVTEPPIIHRTTTFKL